MSNPDKFNPYAAPAPGYVPAPQSASGDRPTWYTFYCVIAIILGSLGVCNALTSTAGLVFGQVMQRTVQFGPGVNAPQNMQDLQEIQEKMNRELYAISNQYFYFDVLAAVLLLSISIGLIVGGIRAMYMTKSGALFLGYVFLATSIFDLLRLVVSVLQQMATSQVMQKYMGPLMEKSQPPGGAAPPAAVMNCMTSGMGYFMGGVICFAVLWTLIKLWVYLSGWIYFNKSSVQALLKG